MSKKLLDYVINMGLAAIAGLGGCIGISIVLLGLLLGIFLDSQLNTDSLFSIICIVISVPVSLIVMASVIVRAVKQIEKRQYGTD